MLCPEHVKTIPRDGFTKQDVRELSVRQYRHSDQALSKKMRAKELSTHGFTSRR